jgi:hypothetical protein
MDRNAAIAYRNYDVGFFNILDILSACQTRLGSHWAKINISRQFPSLLRFKILFEGVSVCKLRGRESLVFAFGYTNEA